CVCAAGFNASCVAVAGFCVPGLLLVLRIGRGVRLFEVVSLSWPACSFFLSAFCLCTFCELSGERRDCAERQ
ncbi:hypothetical protein KEB12_02080, partial [Treponema pallidum]